MKSRRVSPRSFKSYGPTLLAVCVVAQLCAGCVTTTVQEIRQASTGIKPTEFVVVLGRHNNAADESEDDFVSCVSNNLSGGKGRVGVVTEAAFVDAMFPWFEPRTAPLNTSDLPEIVNQPILADKLSSIGVRSSTPAETSGSNGGRSGTRKPHSAGQCHSAAGTE